MTYDQIRATQDLLKVHAAIEALKNSTVQVKALHMGQCTDEQADMVKQLIAFVFADKFGGWGKIVQSGDGTFWRFDKFLPEQQSK